MLSERVESPYVQRARANYVSKLSYNPNRFFRDQGLGLFQGRDSGIGDFNTLGKSRE